MKIRKKTLLGLGLANAGLLVFNMSDLISKFAESGVSGFTTGFFHGLSVTITIIGLIFISFVFARRIEQKMK